MNSEAEKIIREWEMGAESDVVRIIGARFSKEAGRVVPCILSESRPRPGMPYRLPPDFIPREQIRDEKLLAEMENVVRAQMESLRKLNGAMGETAPPKEAIPEGNVRVSNELWAGKPHTKVRDAMRNGGFSDAVIAYVLSVFCGVTYKTEIGRLLHDRKGLSDSAYWRLADKLLKKAATIKITHD